ncbi:MAG: hypothetical protein ACWIPI_05960 [Polaribacter sp.]
MIEDLKKQKTEVVEKKFEKLYEKGFRSQVPIINPENEKLITQLSSEKTKGLLNKGSFRGENENSDDSKLIPDPYFASIVNQNNEIIVNDTLYKFSKNEGLLFVHVKDSTRLYNYLKEQNKTLSRNALSRNPVYRMRPCEARMNYGGVTQIDERISRYLRPIRELSDRPISRSLRRVGIDDNCGGGNYGGSGNIRHTTITRTDPEVTVNNLIQNLDVCKGHKGNLSQRVFGTYRYCHKYFNNSKYRMQIEFWDQRWFIYKSVGVTVQTHKKGWFWWNNIKSDELRLGINKIYLRYKYNEPKIQYFNPNAVTSTPYLYA